MTRLIWGLFVIALSGANASAGARDFFTEFEKDFGTSPRGTVLQHYFIITNNTQQVVNLGQARASCGCVGAKTLQFVLQPGQSTAVLAAMDTKRIPQAGILKQVTVYVPFFGPVMEEVALQVKTITRDDLVMTPDVHAYGEVKKGKEVKNSVKVTLYNHPDWRVTEATSNGKFLKPDFKIVNQTTTEVTYEVTTTLENTCEVGNWSSEVWLKTNTPGIEKIRIPVSVNVTVPISVLPEALTFPNLAVGKETETLVRLTGTQAFKVLQVKGVDDIIGVKAGSEDSRASHTLTITLKPRVSGDLSKSLEILTDNKEMPSLSIPIRVQVPKP